MIVERTIQIYDRQQTRPLLQLAFAVLMENPPLGLLDASLLGLARMGGDQPKNITTAQLSLLAQLLPASSFTNLRKRISVMTEEYKSLVRDPATILTEDFQGEELYFGEAWGCSFQRHILKSLLRDTPILQSSYAQYLQENHPRLDLALLDEWYVELRAGIGSVLDLNKDSAQQLGSIALALGPWDNRVLEVFQRPEFVEPCKRFLEQIRTYADQHEWNDKERLAAAFYALFQNAEWLQEYLPVPVG